MIDGKDFQLLVYTSRRLYLISDDDKFDFYKISDYLMLDIYDDKTIRNYIKTCDDVKKIGGIPLNNHPIFGQGHSKIHHKDYDIDFLKKYLILELRDRIINKIVK
jgi:hypothetical protein